MEGSNSYWTEYRRCGKPRCGRCPHGPYWYGRVDGVRRYYGRVDPRPWFLPGLCERFDGEDIGLACIILDVGLWEPRESAVRGYRIALARCEGKGARQRGMFAKVRAAWLCLCKYQGWEPSLTGGKG